MPNAGSKRATADSVCTPSFFDEKTRMSVVEATTSTPEPGLSKKTGELTPPQADPAAPKRAPAAFPLPRGIAIRLAELIILMAAIVGAIAFGLGISKYLREHRYVAAYLIAYAVFRFADLVVRDNAALGLDRERFSRRIMSELPLLLLFFAAPFERTYIYGGEAPRLLAALGLLIELAGLWLALGARVQLGFFSPHPVADGKPALMRNGLYRFIRHPIYLGEFIVLLGWPFEYGAPVTLALAAIVGIIVMRRRMRLEEAELLAKFGDAYVEYRRVTYYVVPNVW
jgi:protein-S-isoprenylcysteine O-methyltransferase Ste14